MSVSRIFNFNAGPSVLPLEVLEEAQKELLNYKGTGMSILEISHRSKQFEEINAETETLIKELLGAPENYRVLFMQGGASMQFDMVPYNFLQSDKTADYIITGVFADKAYKEAVKLGNVNIAGSTKEMGFIRGIRPEEIKLASNAAYVHITSNNTIYGTQWKSFPEVNDIPLVADMSSDILSRKIDVSKFALIYAGAQKNLGPSGVTVVIIRNDMLDKVPQNLPTMWKYDTYAKDNSLYNTPPVFSIYIMNLVLKWIKNIGLEVLEKQNEEKAKLIYDAIDNSEGFYRGHALPESRSLMNITFRLPSEDLEKKFVEEAAIEGLKGLKGHRSVGGIRASIYNAMPKVGCQALVEFMNRFRKNK